MLKDSLAYSGFAVKDVAAAKEFYETKLGLNVDQTDMGMTLHLGGGLSVFVYDKSDQVPATYTILNFPVDDINAAVDELLANGVTFETYDMPYPQDEKGILRGKAAGYGPDIAWFTDPSGNILSVQSN
jgi:catechol 2,3-dioxygenase-like lactoylglutathione lyase family enzyme